MPRGVKAHPNLRAINGRGEGRDSGGRPIEPPPPHEREAPEAPEWLSDEARAEWSRVVDGLDGMRVLKRIDRSTLTMYCETWSTFVGLQRDVSANGHIHTVTTRGSDGSRTTTRRERAESKLLRDTRAELFRYAREYGLSPASEASAHGATIAVEDLSLMWDPVTRTGNPFAG